MQLEHRMSGAISPALLHPLSRTGAILSPPRPVSLSLFKQSKIFVCRIYLIELFQGISNAYSHLTKQINFIGCSDVLCPTNIKINSILKLSNAPQCAA